MEERRMRYSFMIGNENTKIDSRKEKNLTPKKKYKRRVKLFRQKLSKLVRLINEVDEDIDPIKNNKRFVRNSIYRYGKIPLPIYSFEWKMKFLTIYITEVSRSVEIIVDNIMSDLDVEEELIWEAKEAVLCKIYEDLIVLAKGMRYTTNYSSILLQSNLYTIYSLSVGNHAKYTKKVKEVISNIKYVANKQEDDDILINDIFLLSYVLMTGTFKFKDMLSFKDFEGKTSESNFKRILKEYGHILYDKYEIQDIPIMFWAFRSALPEIYSDFKNINEDRYLNLAVLALYYTGWIINDDHIDSLIHNIVSR